MSADDIGQLIYLSLLVTVIAGYFFLANRLNIGQMLRQAMLWGLIFLGVIAAYGLWNDVQQDLMPRQVVFAEEARVEVPRSPDGHYYMTLEANGTPIEFVVDTGATNIVLSRQDAEAVGIDLDRLVYSGLANTANGTVRSAPVRLDSLTLDEIEDTGVRAWVNEGEMVGSLLGMDYLNRYDRIEISGNRLILER